MVVTLRLVKGSELTYAELDANFTTILDSISALDTDLTTAEGGISTLTADLSATNVTVASKADSAHGHGVAVASGASGFMSGADKAKLDNVAASATANNTDAFLLARVNHTGTQAASSIGNFAASVIATVLLGFAAGTRTTIAATDSILAAFGKVQKYLNDLSALAFSGSASDLTGTKTAAFISDFDAAADARVASATIDTLSDVTITSVADGQVIKRVAGVWVNAADATGGGGSVLNGIGVVTVPYDSYDHTETIAAVGVTPASNVFGALGVFTDGDENSIEFLEIGAMNCVPGTDQITFNLAFLQRTQGLIRLKWSAF